MRLRAEDLRAFQAADPPPQAACACAGHSSRSWESVAAPLAEPAFECVGSLQAETQEADAEEPTLLEWHPAGTNYWSPTAPLALDWFPCNRCTVWRCKGCRRVFLQYTEFGGYYVDHRLRPLDAALVV